MNPSSIISIATAAAAEQFGAADAATIHRKKFETVYQVRANLTEAQENDLRQLVDVPFIPRGGHNVTSDHPVIYATREIVRAAHEEISHLAHTNLRTLIIGATNREFSAYNSNPHIYYYFANKDTRDVSRTVLPIISRIVKNLYSKVNKYDKERIRNKTEKDQAAQVAIRIKTMEQARDLLLKSDKNLPKNILLNIDGNDQQHKFIRLNFQDSIYNFTPNMLLEIFEKTGASEAHGYALLPPELIFPDMPANKFYTVRNVNEKTFINFRFGNCTGYVHETSAITSIFKNQIINGQKFSLITHIEATIGPFVVFRIEKSLTHEILTRTLELPQKLQYVKVLDIIESVDFITGRITFPLKYISVNRDEYMATYNYPLAIQKESVTISAIVTFIRNRMDGANLVNKQLVTKWTLTNDLVYKLAFCVYLQHKFIIDMEELIKDNIGVNSAYAYFRRLFDTVVHKTALFVAPIRYIYQILRSRNLVGEMVLEMDNEIFQVSETNEYVHKTLDLPLQYTPAVSDDALDCDFCDKFQKIKGKQEIICDYKPNSKHTFKLTQDDIDRVITALADDDHDPKGLKQIKMIAKENAPKTPFEHTVRIEYIEGPPGTGKSYTIRKMCKLNHLIYAPFTKLLADYRNVVVETAKEDGTTEESIENLFFKTTHRAFQTRGCPVIWVDEFTSIDYDMLGMVAYLNGAEKVVLVGDVLQTRIQPGEGIYIGNRIDISVVTKHQLIYNFRNGWDTVAMLNRDYGYSMIPASNIKRSVFIEPTYDVSTSDDITMHFKDKTAVEMGIRLNNVRTNQGSTHDKANLLVTHHDDELLTNSALKIVALSRHKEILRIIPDGSTPAADFIASLGLTSEFYDDLESFFPDIEMLIKNPVNHESEEEVVKMLDSMQDDGVSYELAQNSIRTDYSLVNVLSTRYRKRLFYKLMDRCDICLNEGDCLCNKFPNYIKIFLHKLKKTTLQHATILEKGSAVSINQAKISNVVILSLVIGQYLILDKTPSFEKFCYSSNIIETKSQYQVACLVTTKSPLFMLYTSIFTNYQLVLNKLTKTEFTNFNTLIDNNSDFSYDLDLDMVDLIKTFNDKKKDISVDTYIRELPTVFMDEPNETLKSDIVLRIKQKQYQRKLEKEKNKLSNRPQLRIIKSLRFDNKKKTKTPYDIYKEIKNKNFCATAKKYDEIHGGDDLDIRLNEFLGIEQEDVNDVNKILNQINNYDEDDNESYYQEEDENDNNCPTGNIIDLDEDTANYAEDSMSLISYDSASTIDVTNIALPKANTCLIEALSTATDLPQIFVWNLICSRLDPEYANNISKFGLPMGQREIEAFASAYNVKVAVNKYGGNFTSTFVAYPKTTSYLNLFLKTIVIVYERNYLNSGIGHFMATTDKQYLGGFVNPYHSDVKFKQLYKTIDSTLDLDNTNDKHNRFEELFNYNFNGTYLPVQTYVPYEDLKILDKNLDSYQHPAYNSYNLLNESLPPIVLTNHEQAINRYSILNIPDDFSNGIFYPETMFNPINARGNPMIKTRDYYTMSSGYGLHYNALDQWQELQCLQNRYLCRKKNYHWDKKACDIANEIADLFVKECFTNEYSVFQDTAIYDIILEYAEACRKKHYPSQAVGLIENVRSRTVRFSVKNIFKPSKLKFDINKAGQGISAWAKDIQIMIGGIIRILSRHVSVNLKPGIIYNNGLTDEQLVDTMNSQFATQNEFCDTAVIDFDCYDATQNRFTQQIERRIMEKLGMSEYVIDIYYSFRENYPLVTKILKAFGGYTKTSGEPGTLLFNTLLAMALTNYICRGALKVVMLGQGDDVVKRCMKINKLLAEERMKFLQQFIGIRMKIEINKEMEFCGYVITNGFLIPSLARKLKKISGHRFRDYKHFTEYQISLRDTIKFIRKIGISRVVAENANMMGTSYEAAEQHYNMLESFCHIDKTQFHSTFKRVSIEVNVPTDNIMLK